MARRHEDDIAAEAYEGNGYVAVTSLLEHLDLMSHLAIEIGQTNARAARAAHTLLTEALRAAGPEFCDLENAEVPFSTMA